MGITYNKLSNSLYSSIRKYYNDKSVLSNKNILRLKDETSMFTKHVNF